MITPVQTISSRFVENLSDGFLVTFDRNARLAPGDRILVANGSGGFRVARSSLEEKARVIGRVSKIVEAD